MSDNWICIIPEDPCFVPSQEAILQAERFFGEIAPEAERISIEISETIRFRDCGANFESVRCPICAKELTLEWWAEEMGHEDHWDGGFDLQPISLPCGHLVRSLNDLKYHFDQGFSRFLLDAMNPNIGILTPPQILHIEKVLGCPIRVVYQHL